MVKKMDPLLQVSEPEDPDPEHCTLAYPPPPQFFLFLPVTGPCDEGLGGGGQPLQPGVHQQAHARLTVQTGDNQAPDAGGGGGEG
jgi:hypothetical protein